MSSSITRTITRNCDANRVAKQERVYDHFYDPVCTLSSQKDHVKATVKAYASKNRVRRVPEFASMFSDTPRYTMKLERADQVPALREHQWRVHQDQRQEALQQLAGVLPNAQPRLKKSDCQVIGPDYWKFYKRPLIPLGQQFLPDGIFALPKEDFIAGGENAEERPSHFTVGVQTDYRESETQTDPYSPEYVVPAGTSPSELLQLATLTWGHGLPAGLAEVELIERARAKRVWEASLPPLDDLSQTDKRRRMMEEMEAREWAFRDGEIQKLQDARLEVLKELLRERDEAQNDFTESRLIQMFLKLQKDKEARQQKVQNDHMRALRKLDARRKNAERRLGLHGLIRDSPAYVPKIRTDVPSSQNTSKFESLYLDTYEGLQAVEAGLKASVLQGTTKKPKPKVSKSPVTSSMDLMRKYKDWSEEPNNKPAERQLRLLVKKEKPPPRPATPEVEHLPEGDEETELAVIHLQKLLRGRSTQYKMFKGKENHMDLIREQRSVHALQEEEQKLQRAEEELVLTLKKQSDKRSREIAQADASQAGVVGRELEQLFDTMSKELIRLQEERRIHAFMLLAERERRLREAEESGRRQAEERRRREEDEVFRQVVQVHQNTVDLYLEDVILATVDKEADQQAREEIHKKIQEVNAIASAMEESRSDLQSEEIVSELMYSFLIPEIEKINVRNRVLQKQRPHLQAAQSLIQEAAEPPRTQPGTLQPERASETASGQEPEAEQHQTNTE
ncbi:cilia- and flagella-associated protein 91 [Salarias fasciatus]|uniref:cilia- and flagella-associated protein 91 n=1 Tax=Salarias fasciatus TaxID=181472 RepID=UPI001176A54F|nr:cilia- and flagella-associated protein 91 [Salarias fasciatus]